MTTERITTPGEQALTLPPIPRLDAPPPCPGCGNPMEPQEMDDGTPSAFVFWCYPCGGLCHPPALRLPGVPCMRCGATGAILMPADDGSGWQLDCGGFCHGPKDCPGERRIPHYGTVKLVEHPGGGKAVVS